MELVVLVVGNVGVEQPQHQLEAQLSAEQHRDPRKDELKHLDFYQNLELIYKIP